MVEWTKDTEVRTAMQANHDIAMASRDFFSKNASQALDELKNELYKRLEDSRKLKTLYHSFDDSSDWDRGYRTGVTEEIIWLEKLLDNLERS